MLCLADPRVQGQEQALDYNDCARATTSQCLALSAGTYLPDVQPSSSVNDPYVQHEMQTISSPPTKPSSVCARWHSCTAESDSVSISLPWIESPGFACSNTGGFSQLWLARERRRLQQCGPASSAAGIRLSLLQSASRKLHRGPMQRCRVRFRTELLTQTLIRYHVSVRSGSATPYPI